MAMNLDNELQEKKIDSIKLKVLQLESDNIVKKESNPAMVDKIKNMIMTEVDKK